MLLIYVIVVFRLLKIVIHKAHLRKRIYDQEKTQQRWPRMMTTVGCLVRDVLEQERKRCHHGHRSTKVRRGSNRV